jgi:hypothetical protein
MSHGHKYLTWSWGNASIHLSRLSGMFCQTITMATSARALSSSGRAPSLQGGGGRFESDRVHAPVRGRIKPMCV